MKSCRICGKTDKEVIRLLNNDPIHYKRLEYLIKNNKIIWDKSNRFLRFVKN